LSVPKTKPHWHVTRRTVPVTCRKTHIRRLCAGPSVRSELGLPNVTVTIPDELKSRMKKLEQINWSDVARKAFEEKVRREEMASAANGINSLRSSGQTPGWSGAKEIRKWRDVSSSS